MILQTDGAPRTEHPFRMWDAIMETPDFVEKCLQPELAESARSVGRQIVERGISRVYLLGCGSSFYAASSAARAFQALAGLEADAYDSFEFHKYRLGLTPKTAVISSRTRELPGLRWTSAGSPKARRFHGLRDR